MSNVLANHQMDEILANREPEEISITLDRDKAEALHTLLGILSIEGDDNLTELWGDLLLFCNGESNYTVNEPEDTLKLVKAEVK